MPMSASFPRSDSRSAGAGFTLLELLIVLALIGVTAAVVVPGLARTYDAIVGSGERADVVRALEGLPLAVAADGQPLRIDPREPGALAARLSMPDGWTVRLLQPLHIERTGYCHPFEVAVTGREATETWRLASPACEVADAP